MSDIDEGDIEKAWSMMEESYDYYVEMLCADNEDDNFWDMVESFPHYKHEDAVQCARDYHDKGCTVRITQNGEELFYLDGGE